jgi:acyl-CoA thioesterase
LAAWTDEGKPVNKNEVAKYCAEAMWVNDTASQELGITIEVLGAGRARARLKVGRAMINGHDVCHGGYIFTLADTAFAFACNAYDRVTLAASASIDFVRPAKEGDWLTAEASERYRGRKTGIYDVTVTNQADEIVAIFRGRSHATERRLLQT